MSMRWHRRIGLSALVLSLLPAGAAAQDESRSLDELLRSGRLLLGDGVYVTKTGGSRLKGTITDLSTTGMEVVHRGQTWSVAARDLRLIERQDPLADGFAKGFLVSWAIFYGLCEGTGAHYCLHYSLSHYFAIPYLLGGFCRPAIGRRTAPDGLPRPRIEATGGSADLVAGAVRRTGIGRVVSNRAASTEGPDPTRRRDAVRSGEV